MLGGGSLNITGVILTAETRSEKFLLMVVSGELMVLLVSSDELIMVLLVSDELGGGAGVLLVSGGVLFTCSRQ